MARKEILFPKKTDMNVPLITLPNKTVRVKVVMAFLSAFADKAPIIIGIPSGSNPVIPKITAENSNFIWK